MNLVMNRNITVSSTCGHAIKFEKDVPVYVVPMMVSECMAQGAIPAEGEKLPEVKEEPNTQEPPPMGDDRVNRIEAVFEEMVAKNERGTFGASGVPKIDALRKRIAFEIDGGEIKELWKAYKAKINNVGE